MIEVENVSKRYGPHMAVDGISFKVQRGEILGFLGPNGAGKTTTMRILTGYLPATSGHARVAGYDVFDDPLEVKRRVGYIPETPPLYLDMSVWAFLEFCAKIKGVPGSRRAARIDAAMEKTRIGDVRNNLIGRLSKGYRQRVGLAQAILADPEVLILDEPTAGLDPKQIIETRELIKGLGGDHTIVLSTHILPEVSMTCGRVVIINRGKVVAEDEPEALTQRLQGAGAVRVEARGELDALRGAVERVADVRVTNTATHADRVELTVESSGADPRPELARAVVQGGFELLSLHSIGLSLEEIFLQLTTDDAGDPPVHVAEERPDDGVPGAGATGEQPEVTE